MNISIELFTRLICFMTPNVEVKTLTTFYIIVFRHDMLGPVIVVICNEQYKTALYKKLNNSLSNDVSIICQPKLHFEIYIIILCWLVFSKHLVLIFSHKS